MILISEDERSILFVYMKLHPRMTPPSCSAADPPGDVQQPGRDRLPDGGANHVQVRAPEHRPLHRRVLRQAAPLHRAGAPLGRRPEELPQEGQTQTRELY